MHASKNNAAAIWRKSVIAVVFGMAATAMALAPTAHAEKMSENTIRAEGKQAGGTYSTTGDVGGIRCL